MVRDGISIASRDDHAPHSRVLKKIIECLALVFGAFLRFGRFCGALARLAACHGAVTDVFRMAFCPSAASDSQRGDGAARNYDCIPQPGLRFCTGFRCVNWKASQRKLVSLLDAANGDLRVNFWMVRPDEQWGWGNNGGLWDRLVGDITGHRYSPASGGNS